jgi:hypothetical protein
MMVVVLLWGPISAGVLVLMLMLLLLLEMMVLLILLMITIVLRGSMLWVVRMRASVALARVIPGVGGLTSVRSRRLLLLLLRVG